MAQMKEDLLALPLAAWQNKMESFEEVKDFMDEEPAQSTLAKLEHQYGKLQVNLSGPGDAIHNTFHEAGIAPNNWQLATAEYAAANFFKHPKQIWSVGSGMGKSRVAAAIALILLTKYSVNKVYMVFDSAALLQRDQQAFAAYWILNQVVDKVEYHVGLNFPKASHGVIICDEADELIFQAPAKFRAAVQSLKCICMTGTPDNGDLEGLEHKVLKQLGFSIFESFKKSQQLQFDHVLDCSLLELVHAESKANPVIIHCDDEAVQALQVAFNITILTPST